MHTDIPYIINKEKAADVLSWEKSGQVNLQELANQMKMIFVASGDGGFLGAIKKYAHLGLPFFGINRGTVGHLLGPISDPEDLKITTNDLCIITLNMLDLEFKKTTGEVVRTTAFNDIFFNVAHGTACWGEVSGENFGRKSFSGDGVIISTPQGTTAYSRNAGGKVLDLRSHKWFVQTICSRNPISEAVARQQIEVNFSRGKMTAHADNERIDDVTGVIVNLSEIKVRLAFKKGYNFNSRYN